MPDPKPVGAVVPSAVLPLYEAIAAQDIEVQKATDEAAEAAKVATEKSEALVAERQKLAADVKAFAVAVKEQAVNSALGEAEYLQIVHSVFHPEG